MPAGLNRTGAAPSDKGRLLEANMPLDRLVLIVVCVVAAAGAAIGMVGLAVAAGQTSAAWFGLIPAALAGYLFWRVIAERLRSKEDNRYDHIEN